MHEHFVVSAKSGQTEHRELMEADENADCFVILPGNDVFLLVDLPTGGLID